MEARAVLPREAILEYQLLYKKIYGKEISYEQAHSQGMDLINLFKVIYKPIRKEWVRGTVKR